MEGFCNQYGTHRLNCPRKQKARLGKRLPKPSGVLDRPLASPFYSDSNSGRDCDWSGQAPNAVSIWSFLLEKVRKQCTRLCVRGAGVS